MPVQNLPNPYLNALPLPIRQELLLHAAAIRQDDPARWPGNPGKKHSSAWPITLQLTDLRTEKIYELSGTLLQVPEDETLVSTMMMQTPDGSPQSRTLVSRIVSLPPSYDPEAVDHIYIGPNLSARHPLLRLLGVQISEI